MAYPYHSNTAHLKWMGVIVTVAAVANDTRYEYSIAHLWQQQKKTN